MIWSATDSSLPSTKTLIHLLKPLRSIGVQLFLVANNVSDRVLDSENGTVHNFICTHNLCIPFKVYDYDRHNALLLAFTHSIQRLPHYKRPPIHRLKPQLFFFFFVLLFPFLWTEPLWHRKHLFKASAPEYRIICMYVLCTWESWTVAEVHVDIGLSYVLDQHSEVKAHKEMIYRIRFACTRCCPLSIDYHSSINIIPLPTFLY